MAGNNDFSINIKIGLESEGRNLETQWNTLKQKIENDKLSINFGNSINESLRSITQISTQIQNLTRQIDGLNNNGRTLEIFNGNRTNTQIQQTLRSINEVQQALRDIGMYNQGEVRINVREINQATNDIIRFVATVKDSQGILREFNFTPRIEGDNVVGYNNELTRIIDTTHKVTNELEQFRNKYQQSISQIKDTGLINNDSIDNFEQQLNNLNIDNFKNNINNIKTSFKELENQLKTVQQQIIDTEKVVNFSNNMSNNIDNLYANPKGTDLNKLGELSSQNNNLVDYNNVGELQNVKKLYEEIIQLKKEYISQENQQQKEEEKLYTYITTQEERLKNIRGSYNTKLDTGSNGFNKLEDEYNSLVQKLEDYRQRGEKLTVQETTDIKSRINSFNQEKNSIIEVTKIIEQQEQALNSLRNKFGSLIDLQEINNIKNGIQGLSTSTNFKGDSSNITNEINQLREVATERQRLSNMGKVVGSNSDLNIGSSTKDIENFLRNTVSYKSQITSITQEMDKFGNAVKTVNYNVANGNQINRYKLSIDEMSGSVRNLSLGMNDLTSKNASFTESLSNAFSGFIRFQVIAVGVMSAINELKQGLQEISEINKSNINVAMITGDSVENVEKSNKETLELAKNLKVVNSEVLAGQESWMRSGVSQEEANKNLETTTKLSKIAGVANQEMADSLIVIKNAYDLNSTSLEEYASKVSLLDNQSATSSEKINSAMQYSAQTFKSMGVDMDTALSWITNYSEKSAESGQAIGNHFKSLLENFHKLKAAYKSQDEDSVQSVNKIETLLSSKGIQLRKSKDEWNDLGTVVKQIQQNIDKFTDVQKSDLAFKIGGKENAEATLATLNNMKRIDELNTKLKSDSGAEALNNSYEKYKQGIDSQLANLKNEITGFWMNIVDEKKITGAIQGITNLVKILEMLTTTSKTTGIAVIGLATSITVLSIAISKLGFAGVNAGLSSFFSAITKGGATLLTFFQLLPAAMAETKGVTTLLSATFGGLATSIKGVTVAILSSPLTWVVAALGLATYAVVNHIQHQEELKQQVDTLKTSYENLNQAMNENNSTGIKTNTADLEKTQKKLQDLIKQKKELEAKSSTPINTGDIRTDSAINNANTSKLNEVNKTIQEQEKVLKDAGIAYNSLTGEIYKLSEAESKANNLDVVDKIQQTTQAEINNKDAITSLGNEYLSLTSVQEKNSEQKARMSQLAEELKGKVEGLIVTRDKEGNTIVQNTGLLGSEIQILGQEGVSVEKLTQVKLNASKNDAIIQDGITKITYENAKKRIQILQEEANAWNAAANSAQTDSVTEGVMHNAGQTTISDTLKGFGNNAKKSAVSLQEQVGAIDDIYNKATSGIAGTTNELNDGYTPASDGATKSTKKNTEAEKEQKAIIDRVKEVVKEYETELKNLDNIQNQLEKNMSHMDDASQKYRDSLSEEINLLKQKNGFLQKGVDLNNSSVSNLAGYATSSTGIGSQLGEQIVQTAEKYIGTPYVSGGESPQGFDCSGLVKFVYEQLGIQLNRTTYDQVKEGSAVSKDQLQPGDLVFYGDPSAPHHVGIYIGGGEMVESPHTGASVRVASIDRSDYAGARRIVSDTTTSSTSSTTTTLPTSMTYQEMVDAAASKYGLSSALISAVIDQESSWNPSAKSSAGAVGLMQLMSGTAEEMGLSANQRTDPLKNIMAGSKYLAELVNKYGEEKGVALYNTGEYGGGNYSYAQSVLSKKQKYSSGSSSAPNTSVDVTNDTDILSEMDSLNSKSEDYQKQMLENVSKIQDLYDQIYQSQLKFYDNQNAHVDRNKDMAQTMYNLYKDNESLDGMTKASQYKEQIWKEINQHYGVLNQKEQFITSQLYNDNLSEKQRAEALQSLEEVRIEKQKTISDLHSEFQSWQESLYNASIKTNQTNIDTLQRKYDILDKSSTKNYTDKININNEILGQEQQIYKTTVDRLDTLQTLIKNEKDDNSRQVWIDQEQKLLQQLDEIKSKTIEIQQKNIQLAESSALDDVEKAIYGGETQQDYEDSISKRTTAIDQQLEAMQKQNEALQETEERERNLLSLAEAQIKLQDLQNEKSVQTLVKDKDGQWQFQYVQNQSEVDSQEKTVRDQVVSNRDWERDTTQKHLEESLNDEKDLLNEEVSIRSEAYSRIKENLEKAISDNKEEIIDGTITISSLINTSLSGINTKYNGKYSSIISDLQGFINNYTADLTNFNTTLQNSLTSINSATNSSILTGSNSTVWVTDLASKDAQTAKQYYSSLGYAIKQLDTATAKNVASGDILLGAAGTYYTNNVSSSLPSGVTKLTGATSADTIALAQADSYQKEQQAIANAKIQVQQATIQINPNGATTSTYTSNGTTYSTQQQSSTTGVNTTSSTTSSSTPISSSSHGLSTSITVSGNTTTYHYADGYTRTEKYKTGGLNTQSGYNWLDGTPQEPEYVLNAEDTSKMFNAIDILKDINLPSIKDMISKLPNLSDLLPKISMPDISSIVSKASQSVNNIVNLSSLTLSCPNVVDGNSLMEVIQNLPNTITQTSNSNK